MRPSATSPARGPEAPPAAVPSWHAHGLNRVAYYRLAGAAARLLPRGARLPAARAVGRLLARRLPRERRAVTANLARVLGRPSAERLDRAVDETFARFAACFVDLLTLNRRRPERLQRVLAAAEGEDHLRDAFAARRGVIVVTAHLGNWELAGRLMATRHTRPTHVVLSAERDAALEPYLRAGTPGVTFVTRRAATAALPVWAALRREEIVAMQVDRATGGRGDVVVPFFGAPAAFPLGPFVLARASGAPVVPAFCPMTDDGRYRIVVGPPVRVARGGELAALRAVVGALEHAVARHPTQWFNFYDVWGRGGEA